MTSSAKCLVWLFFLLIFSRVVEVANLKFGIPVRPIFFYGVIALGLFVTSAIIGRVSELRGATLFFCSFAAIVIIGILMYRGAVDDPDFGGRVLRPNSIPQRLGYAVWPAINFIAAVGLYILSRREEYRRTIVHAAFVTLVFQVASMEADMWWPAIFGDPNGRAGGFAQNANEAALLVTVLAAILLPLRSGDRFNGLAVYAVMLAVAAVLFSQSRSGMVFAAILIVVFLLAGRGHADTRPRLDFTLMYVAVIFGTILLSPVLNVPDTVSEQASESTEAPSIHQNPPGTLDKPVPLDKRMAARLSGDTIAYRMSAISFYLGILKEHPLGLGTGFTNKFITGPHNAWLKLSVDNGIIDAVVLLAMFWAVTWSAIKMKSPSLIVIAMIAWLDSFVDHAILVTPTIPIAFAIGLGMVTGDPTSRSPKNRTPVEAAFRSN